jgi:hypothetical protein
MPQDFYASDQEGASLSEDGLALYWAFHDSRNRKGVPSLTTSHAARTFGWSERKTRALMDEIEDAGFWQKRDGHPVFNSDRTPPRPTLVWPEPALATPVGRRPIGQTPVNYPTTSSYQPPSTKRNPFGVSPTAPGQLYVRITKVEVNDLTNYFSYRVRKAYGGFAPEPINEQAIRFHIRRWIKDGVPPDVIKAMIDQFVSQKPKPSGGAPVWKVFLAQRQRLLNMVENRTKAEKRTDYWQQKIEEAGT